MLSPTSAVALADTGARAKKKKERRENREGKERGERKKLKKEEKRLKSLPRNALIRVRLLTFVETLVHRGKGVWGTATF